MLTLRACVATGAAVQQWVVELLQGHLRSAALMLLLLLMLLLQYVSFETDTVKACAWTALFSV